MHWRGKDALEGTMHCRKGCTVGGGDALKWNMNCNLGGVGGEDTLEERMHFEGGCTGRVGCTGKI
jgi:hypothetical protein